MAVATTQCVATQTEGASSGDVIDEWIHCLDIISSQVDTRQASIKSNLYESSAILLGIYLEQLLRYHMVRRSIYLEVV